MEDSNTKKRKLSDRGKQKPNLKDKNTSSRLQLDSSKIEFAFDLLSWNLDGLDDRFLKQRINHVAELITQRKPGIIFFQEIIDLTCNELKRLLSKQYEFIEPSFPLGIRFPYYCLIMISNEVFKICQGTNLTYWFPNSIMGRHLLAVRIQPISLPHESIQVITTHLESTYQFLKQRKEQFEAAINHISNSENKEEKCNASTSIFGGDLNMVDWEVKKIEIPHNMTDIWELLGCPEEVKYTWDLKLNSNKNSSAKSKPRRRFDRIFLSRKGEEIGGKTESFFPFEMNLTGTSLIQSCEMFPSDHFGLYIKFGKTKKEK